MIIQGGRFHHKRLITPKNASFRPSSARLKKTLFDIVRGSIDDCYFLDLFAGSGAVGFEALSQGASHVVFVEQENDAIETIRRNIELLGVKAQATLLPFDVFKGLEFLEKKGMLFDVIFADPPYGTKEKSLSNEVLLHIDSHLLLKPGGTLFLEDGKSASLLETPLKTLSPKKERTIGLAVLRQYVL